MASIVDAHEMQMRAVAARRANVPEAVNGHQSARVQPSSLELDQREKALHLAMNAASINGSAAAGLIVMDAEAFLAFLRGETGASDKT